MRICIRRRLFPTASYVLACLLLITGGGFRIASAHPIPVKQNQRSTYGFLLLKSAQGTVIGVGDQVNVFRATKCARGWFSTSMMDQSMMRPRFSKGEKHFSC